MNYELEEVMKYIEEEDAKFIRLAFRDAYGIQKNVSVMPGELSKAFSEGIAINARVIKGFENCPYGLLYLKPDSSTLTVLPWRPDRGKVLRMFCDLYTPEGEPYILDTRTILKKAIEDADKAGIEFRFGSETEFYIFKKDENGNPTKEPYDEAGYLDIAPLDRCENIRREITLTIERMGLTPERSHHERGPGQNEIDFHFGNPLKAADQEITFKMVVSTIADRNGLVADFSPMPLSDKPGNGYHINIYAKNDEGEDVVRYAAAGIMQRIREMTLFLNPTDASYIRFGNSSAPDRVSWSSDGDAELMYVEEYMGRVRAELRSPDASSNPYLIYALLIYAGLDGIANKQTLPEIMKEGAMLPASKKEAIKFANESDFIKKYLPEDLIKVYSM
ncbi:MAG: glutamine synthetase family protein [Lachnospiraceae bacterium]|nr:glutamine synthetase family protein [Lachnospiraceae bacterium]